MADNDHTEEWRPVVGWEGAYSVSSLGRVRRDSAGRGARPGRILAAAASGGGYPAVALVRDGRQATKCVHRLVAAAFLGPRPPGREVDHVNGAKTDNRAANLRYVTRGENLLSAYDPGLRAAGELHRGARLTVAAVRELRAAVAAGEPKRAVARRLLVSEWTVRQVLSGRTWRRVV